MQDDLNINDEGPISLEPGLAEGPTLASGEGDDESISLVSPEETSTGALKSIGAKVGVVKKTEYKRKLNLDGTGATRCRLFYSRIARAALENMEKQVNEWLDENEIEIKHVVQTIGTMEGKDPKPNLLVMVWY